MAFFGNGSKFRDRVNGGSDRQQLARHRGHLRQRDGEDLSRRHAERNHDLDGPATPNAERPVHGEHYTGGYTFGGDSGRGRRIYASVLSGAQIQAHYVEARTDSLPPAVTLGQPVHGSSINDTTPTFSGTAGIFNGDSSTVTVKIFVGPTPSGLPIQTRTTTRQPDGGYSVDATALGARALHGAQRARRRVGQHRTALGEHVRGGHHEPDGDDRASVPPTPRT